MNRIQLQSGKIEIKKIILHLIHKNSKLVKTYHFRKKKTISLLYSISSDKVSVNKRISMKNINLQYFYKLIFMSTQDRWAVV